MKSFHRPKRTVNVHRLANGMTLFVIFSLHLKSLSVRCYTLFLFSTVGQSFEFRFVAFQQLGQLLLGTANLAAVVRRADVVKVPVLQQLCDPCLELQWRLGSEIQTWWYC